MPEGHPFRTSLPPVGQEGITQALEVFLRVLLSETYEKKGLAFKLMPEGHPFRTSLPPVR